MDFIRRAQDHAGDIIAFRRDFHRHPELSFHETRTAQAVCDELDRLSIPYVRLSENSLVGRLTGGAGGGGRVALRADMDALPIQEENEHDFVSQTPGVMHACGHDGHTAMLLGAARLLGEARAQLKGTVYFCFQSAEEVGGGAKPILEYLAREGGVDRVLAAHLWADVPAGSLGIIQGAAMAACDAFTVTVEGVGGHASRPDQCVDPIKPLCQIALTLSSIPTNFIRTLEPCVVHVGRLEAGTRGNIFPQSASLWGGSRTFSEKSRTRVRELVERIAKDTAAAYGARAEVALRPDAPSVLNDPRAVAEVRALLAETGLFEPLDFEPILASENFGEYTHAYPGMMVYIGIRSEAKGLVYGQHHPRFGVDEEALPKGAALFALYAWRFLEGK